MIRTYLIENFAGHKLTGLIAAILEAEGFTCDVSPPGPDFGVDILAGCGPLGLNSPTLLVQVKSESGQIGTAVVNELKGAQNTHGVDQALLVAWGGLTKPAEDLRRTQRLTIRVWTSDGPAGGRRQVRTVEQVVPDGDPPRGAVVRGLSG